MGRHLSTTATTERINMRRVRSVGGTSSPSHHALCRNIPPANTSSDASSSSSKRICCCALDMRDSTTQKSALQNARAQGGGVPVGRAIGRSAAADKMTALRCAAGRNVYNSDFFLHDSSFSVLAPSHFELLGRGGSLWYTLSVGSRSLRNHHPLSVVALFAERVPWAYLTSAPWTRGEPIATCRHLCPRETAAAAAAIRNCKKLLRRVSGQTRRLGLRVRWWIRPACLDVCCGH